MILSIIVAVAQNHAIGKANRLLWHISEDLKYFKQVTSGHTVVMGRKTFESIGKPLPNRRNIIISRSMPAQENITIAVSLQDALALCAGEREVFVIGGGSIYREALPLADRIYYTEVHADYDADTFFPLLSNDDWHALSRQDFPQGEKFPHPFSFVVYERNISAKKAD